MPSRRSLTVSLGLLVAATAAYLVAWRTPAFTVREIEVTGVSGGSEQRVRAALKPLEQSNLISFSSSDGQRLLAPVPVVASARFDREFPNTLRVVVTPEQPVALLRRGRDAWVVAESGRVLRRVRAAPLPRYPRIWLSSSSEPLVGSVLADPAGAAAVRALVPMREIPLPTPIRSVGVERGEVSAVLATGVRVLLGVPSELRLKLAVVGRVLPLAPDAKVIDASVPDRVVAGTTSYTNPQDDG